MGSNTPIPEALKKLVYPKPNLKDWTLDEQGLENTCPLDVDRHNINPQQSLGALDILPLELLSNTLVQLDISSLMNFRRVSQRAMQVVGSIPQFRTIIRHGLSALRGIISIEAAPHNTCQDLYDAMSASRCAQCNDFAGFIYLLDCTRVCFLCFTENARYLPLTPSEASRSFGINRGLVMSSRTINTVPGSYSSHEKRCLTRLLLVDRESARLAGISLHGSALAMEDFVSRATAGKLSKYHEAVADRASGQAGLCVRRPPALMASSNPRLTFAKRFMAIVRAPTVSSPEGTPEWGFHCMGCKRQYRSPPLHWRRKFSTTTFGDHILECGSIIDEEHVPGAAKMPGTDQ